MRGSLGSWILLPVGLLGACTSYSGVRTTPTFTPARLVEAPRPTEAGAALTSGDPPATSQRPQRLARLVGARAVSQATRQATVEPSDVAMQGAAWMVEATSGCARFRSAVRWITKHLEEGEGRKVLVFSQEREVVDELASTLSDALGEGVALAFHHGLEDAQLSDVAVRFQQPASGCRVLVSDELDFCGYRTLPDRLSDHLGVVAEIRERDARALEPRPEEENAPRRRPRVPAFPRRRRRAG